MSKKETVTLIKKRIEALRDETGARYNQTLEPSKDVIRNYLSAQIDAYDQVIEILDKEFK